MPGRSASDRAYPHPRKRFGQHFLEPIWAEKLLNVMAPSPEDTFLEVGPGRGAITVGLAERARQVLAFEIDRDLAAALRSSAPANVVVVEGDFLQVTPAALQEAVSRLSVAPSAIRIAGNLPYNVASPIVFRLMELYTAGLPLTDATLMLQREVADRLMASPGTKDYGVLTILVRHRASVERLLQLPAGAFRPAPRVLSTVVRLRFQPPTPPVRRPEVFTALTQGIFTRRRKTLANALLACPPGLWLVREPREALEAAGIDPDRRPETLTVSEVARLADVCAEHGG